MAVMKRMPATFRCHIMVKGEQCPCDLTLANTFTFSLSTLDRKAAPDNNDVDAKFLAAHAICPWHARFMAKLRKDIARMDAVVSLVERRERQTRKTSRFRQSLEGFDERRRQSVIAHQSTLGAALIEAGVVPLNF